MSVRQTASAIAVVAALAAGLARAQSASLASVNGLSFTADGEALLAAGAHGLALHRPGAGWRAFGLQDDILALAATASAIYASLNPMGLVRIPRGMRARQPLPFEGEARFAAIAAGFRTGDLYVIADDLNGVTRARALYRTRDDGRTWRRAAARGLEGYVREIAAHPSRAATIAAATSAGLFVSHNGGERFRTIVEEPGVTAAAFDARGERLLFVTADADELVSLALDGGARTTMRLPPLGIDIVSHLAPSPVDARALAFATERRRIFLTQDGGTTWKEIP